MAPRLPGIRRFPGALHEPRRRRRLLVSALALAISPIPGLGTLGYFSALVLCLPTALACLGAGVDAARSLREAPEQDRTLSTLLAILGRDVAWIVGLPLAVLGLAMVYNPNCDPVMGVAFHGMGPGLSGVCGAAVGVATGAWCRTRRRALMAAMAVVLASTAVGVARLYWQPCVYFFDPFWGWFSGPIYDEQVGITRRYLTYRGYNLTAVAATLVWWSYLSRPRAPSASAIKARRATLVMALVLTAVSAWFGLQPARHGFTTSQARTLEALPATYETEHFILHYAPRSITSESIEAIATEHEFAWAEHAAALGATPAAPVHSYIYASTAQKRRLFGAGGVEVSLPWKRALYLTATAFPMPVLHHELAHTFGAAFGDPILGLSARWFPVPTLDMAMVEGFAVGLAPRTRNRLDIHDQAAVLHALDMRPPLGTIMGLGFYSQSSSRAYTTAGSFVRWLSETRGADTLGRLYATTGDFEAVYGESSATLEAAWIAFLERRTLPDGVIEGMRERFKRRSVFHRPCAHKVARLRQQIARAARAGDVDETVALRTQLCDLEPERIEHLTALASTLATFEDTAAALAALDRARDLPDSAHTATLDAALARLRGDVGLVTGDYAGAADAYQVALDLPINDARRRSLDLKRMAAETPEQARTIVRYFSMFDRVRTEASNRTARIYLATQLAQTPTWARAGHYLLGRQLLFSGLFDAASQHLAASLGQPMPTDPTTPGAWPDATTAPTLTPALTREAWRSLTEARLRAGRYDDARAALDGWAREPLRSGDRAQIQMWRRRVDFFEAHAAHARGPARADP